MPPRMLSPDVDAALVEGSVSAVRGDVWAMPSTQRWDAGSDVVRILGVPETRTGFVRLDLLGPNAGPFICFRRWSFYEEVGPHWTFGRVDACPSVIEYPLASHGGGTLGL